MQASCDSVPGVVVAGLRGGSGKTIISLGIAAAWKQMNIAVAPFKKGPDYIDAGWLSLAAGRPCYNLDTFLCSPDVVRNSFFCHSQNCDIALVEGNRGLYDGIDTDGSTSTAELARLLDLPVVLVLDCTKSTRTMAALVLGCLHFDPRIRIIGVILNQVAGKRHQGKVTSNIEQFCHLPVFGAIPKLASEDFPERHMGLLTSAEHQFSNQALASVRDMARNHIDLTALYQAVIQGCKTAKSIPRAPQPSAGSDSDRTNHSFSPADPSSLADPLHNDGRKVVIGVIRDSAFQFYYPDNLEALEQLGAKIVFISPLKQDRLPEVDALYMGGGFPETHAPQLAENKGFRDHLNALSANGLPIYAECGGLIFLGKSIRLDGCEYPMSGILPIWFGLSIKPQGHGYTRVKVVNKNPFYRIGEVLKGHEFRYSKILKIEFQDHEMAFSMGRGKGILDKKDGFFKNSTFGTYTHIHALGSASWAPSLVEKARAYKAR
jgi:cobyrinic acid a,c-diamide synthase